MGKKSKKAAVAAADQQLLENTAQATKQKPAKQQKKDEEKPHKQHKSKENKQAETVTIQKPNPALKHTPTHKSGRQTVFTWEEVSKHDRKDDAWLVIDDHVYNVTSILAGNSSHVFLERAGKDATRAYLKNAVQFGQDLQKARIGTIDLNSEIAVWQKESGMSSGRSDAIVAALLGLMILSFMGYLISA